MTLTYADVFAGIGGFHLGFQHAGMTATSHVEIDRHCQTILRRHSAAPILGDIRDVTADSIGRPDVVAGGFPCQDTSIAAPHRAGLAGERSGLYVEFVRLLDEHLRLVDAVRPRWVVIENPVGLLASPGRGRDGIDRTGWDMAAVAAGLEALGYGWAYRVVDGRDVGTPQRRERVVVVGHRGGDPRPAWAVLGDDGAGSETAAAHRVRRDQGGPRPAGRPEDRAGVTIWRKSARARASLAKGGYETWVQSEHGNTLTGFDAGAATRQTHLLLQDGRLRTFTITEWERLQGFPDGWTEGIPDSARYTALGNAMMVPMAAWLGRRLTAVDAALPLLSTVA